MDILLTILVLAASVCIFFIAVTVATKYLNSK